MSYTATLKKEFSGKLPIVAAVIAALYIALSVYAINRTIILSTVIGEFPLDYKITLLKSILLGSWGMYTPTESILTVLIATLMGINIALMVKVIKSLQGGKRLRMSFGGSSILAVVSAGCPSCGVSLLSLAGISSPLLPFQGIQLQVVSVALLAGSIIYSIRKLQQPMTCEVPIVERKKRIATVRS